MYNMSQPSKAILTNQDYKTYRRLLAYLRPYCGRLAVGIFFGLIYAGSNGALLLTLKKGVNNVFGLSAAQPSWAQTALVAALILLASAARGVSDYLSKYLIRWCGSRVVLDLRAALFRKLNELSLSYFVASRSGDLIARTTSDPSLVESAVSNVVEDVAKQPPTLVVLVGVLFWGIFVSAAAKTQLQAYQMGLLSSFLPAFLLSGFAFAIANMPLPVQAITFIVPARYFVALVKGIFLRGVGLEVLWADALFLAVFAIVVIGIAIRKTRKHLS